MRDHESSISIQNISTDGDYTPSDGCNAFLLRNEGDQTITVTKSEAAFSISPGGQPIGFACQKGGTWNDSLPVSFSGSGDKLLVVIEKIDARLTV